jgi:hypothetical protein
MDEVGFGPRREARRPSRRLPAFAAAVSVAGAAAAGIAFAVMAAGGHHAVTSPPSAMRAPARQSAALPVAVIRPPSAVCPPVQAVWPNLASLPAGLRAGALPIVIDEQFSGQCTAP